MLVEFCRGAHRLKCGISIWLYEQLDLISYIFYNVIYSNAVV